MHRVVVVYVACVHVALFTCEKFAVNCYYLLYLVTGCAIKRASFNRTKISGLLLINCKFNNILA